MDFLGKLFIGAVIGAGLAVFVKAYAYGFERLVKAIARALGQHDPPDQT